jgi:cyanobactin maturation PatA/PatG family protease
MHLLEHKLNILDSLNLDVLWNQTLGDPNICIAVLDGPVDLSHPCFKGAALTEIQTLVSDTSSANYALQHGTHVTSIIFGQHGSSVRGIAPQCRGLIVPVFSDGVQGSLAPCSQIDLARAITQAVEHGANIINISGGQMTQSGQADSLLVRAVQLCAENNVLIVAAAGNDGCQCLHLPAALPTVLAVGAMNAQGLPLDFSNWGNVYQEQGILAPGENILGAVPGGSTALKNGTSFATPIVSGIVALLLSLQIHQGESADPQAVRAAILQSALPCNQQNIDCRQFLAGSLDVTAVQAIFLKEKTTTMPDISELNSTEMLQPTESISTEGGISLPQRVSELTVAPSGTISSPRQSILANMPAVTPSSNLTSVTPSEGCGCGGGGAIQLVYALGQLDYDFGTEARLDYFAQNVYPSNPTRAIARTDFLGYLSQNPWEAQSFNWILKLDATPIYAIVPSGPFASVAYDRLRSALEDENVERVSIPGYIAGSIRLLSGQIVPAIVPDIRGMYSWSTTALIESLTDVLPTEEVSPEQIRETVEDYLNRVYYDYRNLGVTPQERALNFSATNAFQAGVVMSRGTGEDKVLDSIEVEKSPICRPDSDCYDVKLIFFDPNNNLRSRTAFRFTIDVSDVIPVLIGSVRRWNLR